MRAQPWDVPVHIIANRPAVLDRLTAHGFHEGLDPWPRASRRCTSCCRPCWMPLAIRDAHELLQGWLAGCVEQGLRVAAEVTPPPARHVLVSAPFHHLGRAGSRSSIYAPRSSAPTARLRHRLLRRDDADVGPRAHPAVDLRRLRLRGPRRRRRLRATARTRSGGRTDARTRKSR